MKNLGSELINLALVVAEISAEGWDLPSEAMNIDFEVTNISSEVWRRIINFS